MTGSAAGFSLTGGENRRPCWQLDPAVINLCFPAVSGRPGHSSPHTALWGLCTPANQTNVDNLISLLVVTHPAVAKPSSTYLYYFYIFNEADNGVAGVAPWRVAAVLVILQPARPSPAAAKYRVLQPAPSLTTSHCYCGESSSYVPGPQSCLLSNHSCLAGLAGRGGANRIPLKGGEYQSQDQSFEDR